MISLEIDSLDEEGRGIGRHEGAAVHVTGALPGDRVTVEIEHRSPHRPQAWARLVAVERVSKSRVPGCCAATGRCGGCPLGGLGYDAQLEHKRERLARALSPLGWRPKPLVRSPRQTGYRSVAKLVYGSVRGTPCLGGYAPRSHELIDLAGCTVIEPGLEAARARILAFLNEERIAAFDEQTGAGLLAYVVLRANRAGQRLATLIGADLDALAPLARRIHEELGLEGAIVALRPRGNAIWGGEVRPVAGLAELEERIGAVRLYVSPTAFFQVNRDVAERIYADVAEALSPQGPVVDLYSGVGGIALTLASRGVAGVTGVEVNPAAIRDATRAAEAQGLRARFVAAEAAAGLAQLEGAIDSVIVNPPRRGLDDATRAAIVAARPRQLVYVSCDPESLARDLVAFGRAGLGLLRAQGYDMHPQTAHVETVAVCERV